MTTDSRTDDLADSRRTEAPCWKCGLFTEEERIAAGRYHRADLPPT